MERPAGALSGRRFLVLELEDAELREALAHVRREEAEALHVGHDLREQHLPELLHLRRAEDDLPDLLHRPAHDLPHVLHEEPVAHQPAALVEELFALAPLGGPEAPEVVVQGEDAEGDVSRLVPHDVVRELGQQRLLAELVHVAEGGHGEPLDHDLHAEVLHVPARVGQDLVEQRLQVPVDRVRAGELLAQIARVDLHVARLVHHLARGVELRLDPGGGGRDLRGGEQRALLAMHELRERPGERLAPELADLRRGHLLPDVRVVDGDLEVGDDLRLGVDAGRPGELVGRVPLVALRLLVEVLQLLAERLVVPRVAEVEAGAKAPLAIPSRTVFSRSAMKSAWARRMRSLKAAACPKTILKTSRLSRAKRKKARLAAWTFASGPRAFSRAASTVAFSRRTVSSTTASKSASLSGKCR